MVLYDGMSEKLIILVLGIYVKISIHENDLILFNLMLLTFFRIGLPSLLNN